MCVLFDGILFKNKAVYMKTLISVLVFSHKILNILYKEHELTHLRIIGRRVL